MGERKRQVASFCSGEVEVLNAIRLGIAGKDLSYLARHSAFPKLARTIKRMAAQDASENVGHVARVPNTRSVLNVLRGASRPLSKHAIAATLGLTAIQVSRTLVQLRKHGKAHTVGPQCRSQWALVRAHNSPTAPTRNVSRTMMGGPGAAP